MSNRERVLALLLLGGLLWLGLWWPAGADTSLSAKWRVGEVVVRVLEFFASGDQGGETAFLAAVAGLFIGTLGRDRTIVVYDRTADLKIPSDLAGVTMVTYQPHSSGDLVATLGAPCTRLKRHITQLGRRST